MATLIGKLMRAATAALWVALAFHALDRGHTLFAAAAIATAVMIAAASRQTARLTRTVELQRTALAMVQAAVYGRPSPPPPPQKP